MKDDLTILIVSYDGYKDMWTDFFNCKEKNWPNCPYETVLANNQENFHFKGVRVVNCGKHAQWSTRARIALETIKTKYVCFMLEDFFISQNVDTLVVEDILSTMKSNQIRYYKLLSLSKFNTPYFNKQKGERIIPANLRYGISLMAAIWDRDYFLSIIGPGDYNPWKFEVDRNMEILTAKETDPISGIYNERNILNICHMVVQGKYLYSAVKKMKRLGYDVNIGSRGCHSISFMIIYWLKQLVYPLYNRSSTIKKIVELVGVKTVSSLNK